MSDEHRVKIANAGILKALIDHALGLRPMSATQVQAGVALMRKILPDLNTVDVNASVEHHLVAYLPQPAQSVTDWAARYAPRQIEAVAEPRPVSPGSDRAQ